MKEFFSLQKRSRWLPFFIIFFLLLVYVGLWSRTLLRFFTVRTHEPVRYVVTDEANIKSITHDLSEKGVIVSEKIFLRYFSIFDKLSPTPGVYVFQSDSSSFDIARTLSLSSAVTPEVKITFPEGLSVAAYGKKLAASHIIDSEIFVNSALSADLFRDHYPFLDDIPEGQGLVGYLFPETYFFLPESSFETVVGKMLDGFSDRLGSAVLEAQTEGKNIHDMVTLASIVEREGKTENDRKLIAGVFFNRLNIGMPLQSDVTVLFAAGSGAATPTGKDLEIDSPYNTYKYNGLPPGPINNPSAESIEAVLHPTASDYFYFLATPDGEVLYSKTYEQHLANKKKYL